jgi:ubiquitin-like protein ATG12
MTKFINFCLLVEEGSPAKIEILLKAVGNAPILKKKKFLLERTKNMHYIIEWLKKYMKLETKEQLFLYVNQEFAPSPDAEIGTIYDCFRTGNTVILHYCTTPAWG